MLALSRNIAAPTRSPGTPRWHRFPDRGESRRLLKPGLAHPFDEFGHWSRRIRNVALDPRDGEIGMHCLQPGKSLARLVDLAVLRQAGAVNTMACGECRTLLQSFAAIFDRFGKASGEIMGDGETRIEN